jgi:hypothetical protein
MVKHPKISLVLAVFVLYSTATEVLANPIPGKNGIERSSSIIENATPAATPAADNTDIKFTTYISEGILYIKYPKPQDLSKGDVIVYNLLGKEVIRKKLECIPINQVAINSQNTCYIVKITYSGKIYTQKIIVSAAQ